MEAFAAATRKISGIYLASRELETKGISVYSTDEKTGIQARKHKNSKILITKEHPERIDPEYIRHGTTGLIASQNVATGEVVVPMIRQTQTEEDFAEYIADVVSKNPLERSLFVFDNLNTHKSDNCKIYRQDRRDRRTHAWEKRKRRSVKNGGFQRGFSK